MSDDQMLESAMRCLDRALDAMNRAVEMTAANGPAVAMEFIADFLNDTDGIDEDVADATPDDWLDRWQVTLAAAVAPPTGGMCARCVGEGWTSPDDPRPSTTCDDCNGTGTRMTAAPTGPDYNVHREGEWWVINIPGVGVTQARREEDIERMARDLVESLNAAPTGPEPRTDAAVGR